MIETIVLDFLTAHLDVSVHMEIPEEQPDTFVLLERTGGGEENHIQNAMFAIQSYGATLYQAAALNEKVKKAMKNIIEVDAISTVSLNSDYNWTDKEKKKYRYQAVYDLVYYETEVEKCLM